MSPRPTILSKCWGTLIFTDSDCKLTVSPEIELLTLTFIYFFFNLSVSPSIQYSNVAITSNKKKNNDEKKIMFQG